jgi:heterodisulfide reductase subunit A
LSELTRLTAVQQQSGSTLTINGRRINSLALIHCVGNRHIPGAYEAPDGTCHEYCSRTCCTAALDTAAQLRQRFADTVIYDLHRDIRTYGRGHEDIYREASNHRVIFIRYEADAPPQVHTASCRPGSGQVGVTVKDVTLGNEELALEVDLVVLVTGVVPAPTGALVEQLKVTQGADGFLLEVHPKLRPVEPAVSGIYLAGSCQAPMDSAEAVSAAGAAAAKASAILGRGYVELDPFIAQVDQDKCKGHGMCAQVCIAEGALEMRRQADGSLLPRINPALCLGCGVCAAICPEEAINVAGWTLDHYRGMVDALLNEPREGGQAL